jgi:hypothetical protein
MRDRFLIVDDFFGHPDELVRIALDSIKKEQLPRGTYVGVMTTEAYLGEQQRQFFRQLTMRPTIDASTNACGKMRFTLPKDPYKFHIHYFKCTILRKIPISLTRKYSLFR